MVDKIEFIKTHAPERAIRKLMQKTGLNLEQIADKCEWVEANFVNGRFLRFPIDDKNTYILGEPNAQIGKHAHEGINDRNIAVFGITQKELKPCKGDGVDTHNVPPKKTAIIIRSVKTPYKEKC